jgi:hypothetical protein
VINDEAIIFGDDTLTSEIAADAFGTGVRIGRADALVPTAKALLAVRKMQQQKRATLRFIKELSGGF